MSAIPSSLFQDLRALPGAFWVLCAGTFVNRFGSFVYPFLTIALARRGVPLVEIGVVLGGYGAGSLASTLAGGWFADGFGRRRTIIAGTMAQAAAVMALYFATETPVLTILTALVGFFGGFYHPAANALVADLVPTHGRLTAYAVLRQCANGGFAFGTAAGGLLVNFSPFWLFAGDALTTAAFGVIAFLALPEGVRVERREARWSEAIARLRKDGAFWALFLAQFAAALIFAQFASTYALEITRREIILAVGGWSFAPEQVYGLLIGLNGLMILGLELPLTRWSALFQARRVMAVGYCLTGIGFAANIISWGLTPLVIGMALFTLGEMLVIPMVNVRIAHIAPMAMRGRYIGALATAWALGTIVGQNLGLRIYAIHPAMLWSSCALFGFAAASVITALGREQAAPIPGPLAAARI